MYDTQSKVHGQSLSKSAAGQPAKMRCVARLAPNASSGKTDGGNQQSAKVKFTCLAFTSNNPNESQLIAGTSNG